MKLFLLPQRVFRNSNALRRLLTLGNREPRRQQSIYVSKSTNPYFNLSLEDWLFRNKGHKQPLLLIYRDEPCVIIGRNQNPWKEINIPWLRREQIPFVRRKSGGGTVYHDLGNTNYSIHVPRTSFNRKITSGVVVRALRSLGLEAEANERNDVSGSAYKIANNRAYHHGTMLISSNLTALGQLLHSDKETMVTKGVASVRSPVCNLCDYKSDLTHDDFVTSVISSFRDEFGWTDTVHFVDNDAAGEMFNSSDIEKLTEWNWAYGQTPEFEYIFSNSFECGNVEAKIVAKHGIILSCVLKLIDGDIKLSWLDDMGRCLVGQRYGFVEKMDTARSQHSAHVVEQAVWDWLLVSMDQA